MPTFVKGIHHITAIAGDPQENVNFYIKFLGLKFVKKTVNFDDPFTYHFYFGNETGNPGTIITFFPWGKEAHKGKPGSGQVTTISYSITKESLDYWTERLKKFNINFTGPFTRFNEIVILFEDPDGIELELVTSSEERRGGWNNGEIPAEFSIRGFYTAALSEYNSNNTKELLTNQLGFKKIKEENNRIRFESGEGGAGTYIDILETPGTMPGRMGVGAIHHIAFRAENDNEQIKLREQIENAGLSITQVIDRNYFHSVYFREPGNILFEVATDNPGFLIDEEKENLGKHLKLPQWYESKRKEIESALPEIKI